MNKCNVEMLHPGVSMKLKNVSQYVWMQVFDLSLSSTILSVSLSCWWGQRQMSPAAFQQTLLSVWRVCGLKAWSVLPNIFTLKTQSSCQKNFNFKKNVNSKDYIFHALWPKPLQGLCRWSGEGRKNRLRNEAASERKLDLLHATHNTLAHQINSS